LSLNRPSGGVVATAIARPDFASRRTCPLRRFEVAHVELARLDESQFERFRSFIYEQSGIRVDSRKVTLLSNRIRRRLKAGGFVDFDSYYRHLTSVDGKGEVGYFLDAVTTNETFFYRTKGHFDWFSTEFLAEAVHAARNGDRQPELRIWSAGCASGAEAYTIAICLAENSYRLRDWTLSIVATDISEEALQTAREAVFKTRAVEAVPPKLLRRYFQDWREDGFRQVRPEIRQRVQFQRHNLMEPIGHVPFDCIFIRNVLIYFDRESKRCVVDNLVRALAPGGYLVVGPSEGIYDMLGPLEKRSVFLYQKAKQKPAEPTSRQPS
jgi:chemotaxis protein methyltransferase CheR